MPDINAILQKLDAAALAERLIAIPSYSFLQNQEQAVADEITRLLESEGIETYQQPVAPGRPNVIGRIPGGSGPSLMLCGHLDTVPAYDMKDAFSPYYSGNVLHGRGACDMKGAVAAMLVALIAIKRSGAILTGDLIFAGVADEEEGGLGAEYLADHGPFADAAIIGEPTDLELALGHKGLEWIAVDVSGKKVHGGDQAHGVNAIQMAARLVDRIYNEYAPLLRSRTHPVLGHASINVGRIEGGDQPSTVAGSCRLLLDRRAVPGETREQVYAELRALCESLHAEDANFSAVVSDLMQDKTQKPHYPFCVQPDAPVAHSLLSALRNCGLPGTCTAFPAWSDAGTLARYTRCTPVVCGPGQLKNAHSVADSVTREELSLAARVYAGAALSLLQFRKD